MNKIEKELQKNLTYYFNNDLKPKLEKYATELFEENDLMFIGNKLDFLYTRMSAFRQKVLEDYEMELSHIPEPYSTASVDELEIMLIKECQRLFNIAYDKLVK